HGLAPWEDGSLIAQLQLIQLDNNYPISQLSLADLVCPGASSHMATLTPTLSSPGTSNLGEGDTLTLLRQLKAYLHAIYTSFFTNVDTSIKGDIHQELADHLRNIAALEESPVF
ncbi:Hypothetical predicted protein, partial [Pelobates cultripes]